MRIIMLIEFPVEPFNTLTRNGTAGKKIKRILDTIKPESTYFTERDGKRGAILVVNMENASEIPMLAEPWFLVFSATVELRIAMVPEDLEKANLGALGKKWSR